MSDWDRASGWVRLLIGYAIWFVILLLARHIVLSLQGVVNLGFAIAPSYWGDGPYLNGLFWLQVFDMAFRTVLVFTVLACGRALGDALTPGGQWGKKLSHIVHYGMRLGALTIAYFAYRPLLLPLLESQGAGWAYSLIFWVVAAAVLLLGAFECARSVSAEKRHVLIPREAAPAQPRVRESGPAQFEDMPVEHGGATLQQASCEHDASAAARPTLEPAVRASEVDERDRVLSISRPAFAGATAKSQLSHFLQICNQHKGYKMVAVAYVTAPSPSRTIRFVGIPADRPLEATALEILTQEEFATWERTTLEGLVILSEP